jgi:hypothetical protein
VEVIKQCWGGETIISFEFMAQSFHFKGQDAASTMQWVGVVSVAVGAHCVARYTFMSKV